MVYSRRLTGTLSVLGVLDIFEISTPDPLARTAGAACALILLGVRFLTRGGIGIGDVKLTAAAGILPGYDNTLAALGFDITRSGPQSLSVRSIPALLSNADPEALLRDVLADLREHGESRRVAAARDELLDQLGITKVSAK